MISPAGMKFPLLAQRNPITPPRTTVTMRRMSGFGGSCEVKYAPTPIRAPKTSPAAIDGTEPRISVNEAFATFLLFNKPTSFYVSNYAASCDDNCKDN